MLSDLTDPSAIRSAAAEFDEIGRDQFLAKHGFGPALRYLAEVDGRLYDSKALLGVAHGIQHPDLGPLRASDFSGGDTTVRPILERLGFSLVDRKAQVLEGLSLQAAIEAVCELLHHRQLATDEFDAELLDTLIKHALPELIADEVGDRGTVRGRTGIGTAADVPWVGCFPREAASAQEGFYLVYLFAKDGSATYLSLNQGTEGVKGGAEVLHKRAIDLQRAVQGSRDLLIDVDLRSDNARPKKYEAGSALAVRYARDAVPDDETLKGDLTRMLGFLDEAATEGLRWDPTHEPLHLVFKWNADREPRTIDLHTEIAAQEGSVWWGRFSSSPRPSIAKRKLEALQHQLASNVPTHAYLYRRGSLWRATLREVRTEPPEPDDPRFPTYYKREDCNLFVRLSDFEELASDWLASNVVLASQPDPDPARVSSALSNQTTPLFVFELFGSQGPDSSADAVADSDDEIAQWTDHDLANVSLADICQEVAGNLDEAGLRFGDQHDEFVRTALVSLATKRFLLLTGLSGSGKTRLGIGIGEWFGPDRLEVVPVRPDWTGPESLLGFENGLSPVRDGRHAWTMPRSLDFILRAAGDPAHPYLLLLDEMNLAHVERYFADALSGMESRTAVVPNLRRTGDEWRPTEPTLVPFPTNLFVVGTVNIDETTYMFSPKVLDRANTLEFRVRTSDLQIGATSVAPVEPGQDLLVHRFLVAATTTADDDWAGRSQLGEWLAGLHEVLSEHDREFGHRVFLEALRFGALLAEAGEQDPMRALDLQVLQKVLPKIHGSIREVGETINALGAWTWYGPQSTSQLGSFDPLQPPPDESAVLPLSFDKLRRMTRKLRSNHFVSFAE